MKILLFLIISFIYTTLIFSQSNLDYYTVQINAEQHPQISFNAKKLAVISGFGARDWFYEMGYKLDGVYVSKTL